MRLEHRVDFIVRHIKPEALGLRHLGLEERFVSCKIEIHTTPFICNCGSGFIPEKSDR